MQNFSGTTSPHTINRVTNGFKDVATTDFWIADRPVYSVFRMSRVEPGSKLAEPVFHISRGSELVEVEEGVRRGEERFIYMLS